MTKVQKSRASYRRSSPGLRSAVIALALLVVTGAALWAQAPAPADIQAALDAALSKYRNLQEGKNADYIPALAKVDPNIYGIALVTVDGKVYTAGDITSEVSIQSISKVFTMAQVVEAMGPEAIRDNMGVDATGQAFNSIVAVEQFKGSEMNAMVNAGAITATSMIPGANRAEIWNKILAWQSDFAGRPLTVNQEVYKSEAETNQRNQAIAQLMYAYGHIKSDPLQATDLYTEQCSISVNAKDLAVMAATLANAGKNPVTGKLVMNGVNVPEVLAVMATAGLYDDTGKWLYATGLPAKSGVGGGIIAVSPGKFGIAVIAPPLDAAGNSVKGQKAIADISNALGGNPYGDTGPAHTPGAVQEASEGPLGGTTFTVNGFAMLDMGYQTKQNDSDWFDVLRPTKLPAFEDEFGEDGHFYSGVRQSRLGVRSSTPTKLGELKTIFEFELFGTGVDAGQTTLRLRHAYGELGQFGAGQTWSPFMDIDVFPNTVEYWGPNGMAFFRNVQVRWMPIKGDSFLTFALERPGASGDQGDFADRIELSNIKGHFPIPDVSAEWRLGGKDWGYVEIAGIARYIEWDDLLDDGIDLSGDEVGWGLNLSSNIKLGDSTFRWSALYGEGIENYMNDAPADVGVRVTGDPFRPIEGELLPVLGISAFIDFVWGDHASSAIGYSMVDIDNSNGQAANAFKTGHYAIANIMFYPVKNVMMGPELQWGERENFRDGFTSDDFRIQFSAKYNFGHTWGGN